MAKEITTMYKSLLSFLFVSPFLLFVISFIPYSKSLSISQQIILPFNLIILLSLQSIPSIFAEAISEPSNIIYTLKHKS